MMDDFRDKLRRIAMASSDDGMISLRRRDVLAMLDDLDDGDALRAWVSRAPKADRRHCRHLEGQPAFPSPMGRVIYQSGPASRADAHTETTVCAMCAAVVTAVLTELERAVP